MSAKAKRRDNPSFVGLYSGCGGFDLGFIAAGFQCVAAYDIDPVGVDTYRSNIGDHIHHADVRTSLSDIVSATRRADVLVAGPPCQGFSTAGKRALDDPRNSLLSLVGDIAVAASPAAVVVENVAGVLAGTHQRYWNELRSRLSASGYSCVTVKCLASEFGVPQRRVRVVLLALRGVADLPDSFVPIGAKAASLREALSGVDGLPNHEPLVLAPGTSTFHIAQRIDPGQKLCNVRGGARSVPTWDIPHVFGVVSMHERAVLEALRRLRRQNRVREFGDADPVSEKALSAEIGISCKGSLKSLIHKDYVRRVGDAYDLTNTFNGKFRRLSWDDAAPTVDTRFGQPRYFLHPEHDRGLSVREAARIQGFPDTFVFSGSNQAQFRMVGNAVPPPLGRAVAQRIRDLRFK